MRKKYFLYFLFAIAWCKSILAQDRDIDYVQRYALLAVKEMEIYKIPASITLAQGILETGGGQSKLANQANNHFGIKCKTEWTGETITHDDDALGECFRKYASVEESYRDHSKFLAERPYYKNLFKLNLTDYKAWAHGLKKAGYATNPRYAYILINKIEKLHLHQFDLISNQDVYDQLVKLYGPVSRKIVDPSYEEILPKNPVKVAEIQAKKEEKEANKNFTVEESTPPSNPVDRILEHPNHLDYIVVEAGETIKKIADLFNISQKNLMLYNELKSPKDLKAGQFLFFNHKKNWGQEQYHTVKPGETMYLIAQKHAMRVSKLYYKNRMEKGQEPQPGDILYLRGRKPKQ